MTATEETIGYYDGNAKKFIADTANVEFGALQKAFADMLPEGGRILDLGCGSGRDSLAFLKAGFGRRQRRDGERRKRAHRNEG